MTKSELKLGGPGHDGYAYKSEVFCVDCGHAIIDDFDRDYLSKIGQLEMRDSEIVPQPIRFGESDAPQHCAECGECLYGTKPE